MVERTCAIRRRGLAAPPAPAAVEALEVHPARPTESMARIQLAATSSATRTVRRQHEVEARGQEFAPQSAPSGLWTAVGRSHAHKGTIPCIPVRNPTPIRTPTGRQRGSAMRRARSAEAGILVEGAVIPRACRT